VKVHVTAHVQTASTPKKLQPNQIETLNKTGAVVRVISGFRRQADENCPLLVYNAASGGNYLSTFRDNISVPSSSVKNLKTPLKM
jgi:hypothetical protein